MATAEVVDETTASDLRHSANELGSAIPGIRDWRIWRSGRELFHLVACDDFDAAMREIASDPANEQWPAFIADHLDHFEAWPSRLLWRMRDQRTKTPL